MKTGVGSGVGSGSIIQRYGSGSISQRYGSGYGSQKTNMDDISKGVANSL
jgi:hypothetical protein